MEIWADRKRKKGREERETKKKNFREIPARRAVIVNAMLLIHVVSPTMSFHRFHAPETTGISIGVIIDACEIPRRVSRRRVKIPRKGAGNFVGYRRDRFIPARDDRSANRNALEPARNLDTERVTDWKSGRKSEVIRL